MYRLLGDRHPAVHMTQGCPVDAKMMFYACTFCDWQDSAEVEAAVQDILKHGNDEERGPA